MNLKFDYIYLFKIVKKSYIIYSYLYFNFKKIMEEIYIYKKQWEKQNLNSKSRPSSGKNIGRNVQHNFSNIKYTISLFSNMKIGDNEIKNLLKVIFNQKNLNKNDFLVYYIIYNINDKEEKIKKRILSTSMCILYCDNIIDNILYIKTIEDILFNNGKIFEKIPFKIIIKDLNEDFKLPNCFKFNNNNLENSKDKELLILRDDENLEMKKYIPLNEIESFSFPQNIINFKPKFSIFLDNKEYQIRISISFPYYSENKEKEQVVIKEKFLYTRIFDYYFYLFGERKVNIDSFDYSNIDIGSFEISFSLPFTIFKDIIILKFKLIKCEYIKNEGIYEIIYGKEI